MQETICKKALPYVKSGDLYMLTEIYNTYNEARDPYVFQRVFLSACVHKKINILSWLCQIYNSVDYITQIALKPTIIHGKYIIKDKQFLKEYNTLVGPILNRKKGYP